MGLEKINYMEKRLTVRETKLTEEAGAEKELTITDKLLGMNRRKG